MTEKNCIVLDQYRNDSEYNDFIGKFYHFPKKYINLLKKDNTEFIYHEPTKKSGSGAYFGYGKIGKIFEDKKTDNCYFAEIIEYQPFEKDVPFFDKKNNVNRETEPFYNAQNAVRRIRKKI